MKLFTSIIASILVFSMMSCGETATTDKKASIKDNSTKDIQDDTPKEYTTIPSEDLAKHIQAHFDLGQYELGKEKLTFLINDRPDLVDSLNLSELSLNFDDKLEEIRIKNDEIAEKERKSRMPNATKMMRTIEKDPLTIYVDKTSPKFDSKETFHAYYTKDKAGNLNLYLKVKYIATSWLNIESYMVTVDQLDYEFSGDVEKLETKGKKKYKHETIDELIDTPEELETLNAIANGEDVKAVYVGKSTYKERFLTTEQKLALRNVLDAYLFSTDMSMPDLKAKYANNN